MDRERIEGGNDPYWVVKMRLLAGERLIMVRDGEVKTMREVPQFGHRLSGAVFLNSGPVVSITFAVFSPLSKAGILSLLFQALCLNCLCCIPTSAG